jgi:MFS family permease
MSQFLFQTPAGYLYDYTESKVLWLSMAAIATTLLTVFTAAFAQPYGANLSLMIFVKFLQGAVTSFIPPGLNSITQGIVGASGMTSQVSTNEMMNHLGTAIIVLTASVVGVILYPDLGRIFGLFEPHQTIGY